MSSSDIRDELEPVLNLTPLVSATDTIRSFCDKHGRCEECQMYNTSKGRGCYFNVVTPDTYDVGEMIYNKTEEIGKNHKTKSRKEKKT